MNLIVLLMPEYQGVLRGKGFLRGNVVYFDNGSGALQSAEASYTVVEKGGTESKTNNGIEFNASRDNPIYSDDNLKPTVDALFGLNRHRF